MDFFGNTTPGSQMPMQNETRLYCTVTKEQVRASHRRYMSA